MNNIITKNNFYWKWLVIANIFLALYGLFMNLFPEFAKGFFGLMIYSDYQAINNFPKNIVEYVGLTHSVIGAVIFGWSLSMLFNLFNTFRDYTIKSWLSFTIPLLGWFIVDTTYSLYSGFISHAIFNLFFLIALGFPLIITYKNINQANSYAK